MGQVNLSIIIPVYNSEMYIEKALNSVLRQPVERFEVIVVNDASTDSSLDIVKKYTENDSRIKVLNLEKSGVVKARQEAAAIACGEYLLFLDSDDYIPDGIIAEMLEKALRYNVDMVVGDIIQEVNYKKEILNYGYSSISTGDELFNWIVDTHTGFLWGKIIRKSLFNRICYVPYQLKFCEDFIQMLQLCKLSNTVMHIHKCSYVYVQHDSSTCNKRISRIEFAYRFYDLSVALLSLLNLDIFTEDNRLKLKVLFLYYARLFLWVNGDWPNSDTSYKKIYFSFVNDYDVVKDIDKRKLVITRLSYRFPFLFSLLYVFLLRYRYGRIF